MLKFGLIGEHLEHSLSPALHIKIMNEQRTDGSYELIEIPKEMLPQKMEDLKNSDVRGINVTIPYKQDVLPFLDEISPQAKAIGAVNTILFDQKKAIGYNTDYDGFLALLSEIQCLPKGKTALILGAGGVAKAVIKALQASEIQSITVASRRRSTFMELPTVSYQKLSGLKANILINCTPVGMFPKTEASPLTKETVAQLGAEFVFDLIYNPQETRLLLYARELGIPCANGATMLQAQALAAQQIWNGASSSTEA